MLVEHRAAVQAAAGQIDGDVVAGNHVAIGRAERAADTDLHVHRAVIDAVHGGDAGQARHVERPGRDAARGGGAGAGERVVGGVAARQHDAADEHGLAGAHVLGAGAAEVGGLGHADHIASDEARRRARHRRCGGAVIDAGAAGVGGAGGPRCDVGGGCARGVDEAVVAGVDAGQRTVLHVDGLADARVARNNAAQAATEHARGADEHAVAGHDVGRAGRGGGRRGAVIHAADARVAGRQVLWCDVDRDAAGAGHAVVAGVRAAQRQAGHGHGLGATDVLVGQGARGLARGWCGDGDDVTSDQVARVQRDGARGGDRDGHRARAVIDAVSGRDTRQPQNAQRPRRDAAGGAGAGVEQAVVDGVGACQRDAAHVHRLAGADVLGPGATEDGRLAEAHAVAADQPAQVAADRRGGGAVIDACATLEGHGGGARRDVGAGAAGVVEQGVVAGVGAAQCARSDGDGFANASVLASAEDTAAADAEAVAGHHVGRRADDAGCRAAVIDAVDAGVNRNQRLRRDVDGDAVGGRHGVVAGIRTSQRQAVHHQCLVEAGILVQHRAGRQARRGRDDADDIAGHDVGRVDVDAAAAGEGDADRARAVINAVLGGHAGQARQADGLGRDGAHCAGVAGQQLVVDGVAAGQRDAGDLDRLAGARIACAAAGEAGALR